MSSRKSHSRNATTPAATLGGKQDGPDQERDEVKFPKNRAEAIARHARECGPILKELAENGFVFASLDDLRKSGTIYRAAVPVLLKWLPRVKGYDVKESIVRTLTVPWAKPEAAREFIAEFRNVKNDEGHLLKWAIGNGLTVVADETVSDDLIDLATDARHGKSREMIAVALGNMRDSRVGDVLTGLLQDEEMVGHAIVGLGRLKSLGTRSAIEPFLKHRKSWIRAEAKKAIERIDRAALKAHRTPARKRIPIQ